MASTSQSVAPLKRPLGGRPSTNPIRQYFSYDPASNKSNCLVELNGGRACGKEYEGQTNTTFENHLRSNHRTQYNEFVKQKEAIQEDQAARKTPKLDRKVNGDVRDFLNGKQSQKEYDDNDPK
jgi:hypothetical protein